MKYAKGIVAAVSAGLVSITQVIPITALERGWITVALVVLGASGVVVVKNQDGAK